MIYELRPFVSPRVWGGAKLSILKNIQLNSFAEPIGETWEVSTHSDGTSTYSPDNKLLSELGELNYLIKFLDTSSALSIQVHPDDEYSKIHEAQKGKLECWIILEAEVNAGIYLGFKKGATKKHLKNLLETKEDLSESLNFYPVSRGDFFLIPPGTIHAIGAGVTMVEVQQSSGVTYRVWDWNRLDSKGIGRELHIDKAFDVLEDDPSKNTNEYFHFKKQLLNLMSQTIRLVDHIDFELDLMNYSKNTKITLELTKSKFTSIIVLCGKIKINNLCKKSYDSILITNENSVDIFLEEDSSFIIVK